MAVDLVTGGTGSFGHAYVAALATTPAGGRHIRVLSRDEEKQRRMARHYPEVEFILGDVRDRAAVRRAMRGVDRVFHAAALKQVPQGERNPGEYTRTNVLGTENVCVEAAEAGARLVYLSTDKALYPASAMGASKLLGELVARGFEFNSVRYGNVIGSRGSIIPVWRGQLAAGEPITITDPAMRRFLITLPQAVELIELAMSSPMLGTTYVRKSPVASVEQLARVFAPGHPAVIMGTRAGEKHDEELVAAHEFAVDHGWYFAVGNGPPSGIEFTTGTAPAVTDVELAELLEQAPAGDYG